MTTTDGTTVGLPCRGCAQPEQESLCAVCYNPEGWPTKRGCDGYRDCLNERVRIEERDAGWDATP